MRTPYIMPGKLDPRSISGRKKKDEANSPLPELRLPTVKYPRFGFVESGEVRPPKKGEYFKGILGYPLQAKSDWQITNVTILVDEKEYNRRISRIFDAINKGDE